jgi:putative Holliday junction resolvase
MAKIVALDVGAKRTGVAESDAMHMMAFPLETVETEYVLTFLQRRQEEEPIEELVVGAPVRWDGTPSEVAQFIDGLCQKIGEKWPKLHIIRVDERFTSSLAADALVKGGMKKSKRREKGAVDKVAAALILENYLAQR